MRQMVAGDEKKKMKVGDSMDVEMSQVSEDADEETTGFKIPDLDSLLGNQTDNVKTRQTRTRQSSVGAMVGFNHLFFHSQYITKVSPSTPHTNLC